MGAWGVRAFDNDSANDWAYGLDDAENLTIVNSAIAEVLSVGDDYLDADLACDGLAACEVIARLRGRPGYTNAYTERVDAWVAAHSIVPSAGLVTAALTAIDRILGDNSELAELWAEGDDREWRASVADLRGRVGG